MSYTDCTLSSSFGDVSIAIPFIIALNTAISSQYLASLLIKYSLPLISIGTRVKFPYVILNCSISSVVFFIFLMSTILATYFKPFIVQTTTSVPFSFKQMKVIILPPSTTAFIATLPVIRVGIVQKRILNIDIRCIARKRKYEGTKLAAAAKVNAVFVELASSSHL